MGAGINEFICASVSARLSAHGVGRSIGVAVCLSVVCVYHRQRQKETERQTKTGRETFGDRRRERDGETDREGCL